jgi:arsenate reductase (thioredoxin)
VIPLEMGRVHSVLFLCTHNSARSIMAEAILNHLSVNRGRFKAYSAGSHPAGTMNQFALEQIRAAGLPAFGLRSKSWDEFALPDAPRMDFVFTVRGIAAAEECPVWPGNPITAHWGLPDPAAVEGTDHEKRRAFSQTFIYLYNRINIFASLPLEKLDRTSLRRRLDEIGTSAS